VKLEKKDPQLFDWSSWRNGSPVDLLLSADFNVLTSSFGNYSIKRYAIAYCDGEQLIFAE